jgi:tripartite-type tricarboxylate transporter receptor subunit TctC
MRFSLQATLGLALGALIAAAPPGTADAAFPEKPIRIINSSAPGSTGDVLARTVAESMSRSLGVPITVEGKSDAMYALVKSSPPDGYTLAAPTISFVLQPSLSANPTHQIDEFVPIAHLGAFASAFAINPSVEAQNLKELVELSNNEGLFYGYSGGVAITFTELLKQATGLKAEGVPYDNANEGTAALLSNEIQMYYTGVTNFAEHVQAGTLRGLFVSGDKRHDLIPDVPTLAEAGFPEIEALEQWNGLYAPKGTPDDVVQILHDAVIAAFKDPQVEEAFKKLHVQTRELSVEDFKTYVEAEHARWKDVITKANIRMD